MAEKKRMELKEKEKGKRLLSRLSFTKNSLKVELLIRPPDRGDQKRSREGLLLRCLASTADRRRRRQREHVAPDEKKIFEAKKKKFTITKKGKKTSASFGFSHEPKTFSFSLSLTFDRTFLFRCMREDRSGVAPLFSSEPSCSGRCPYDDDGGNGENNDNNDNGNAFCGRRCSSSSCCCCHRQRRRNNNGASSSLVLSADARSTVDAVVDQSRGRRTKEEQLLLGAT